MMIYPIIFTRTRSADSAPLRLAAVLAGGQDGAPFTQSAADTEVRGQRRSRAAAPPCACIAGIRCPHSHRAYLAPPHPSHRPVPPTQAELQHFVEEWRRIDVEGANYLPLKELAILLQVHRCQPPSPHVGVSG
jgi:hypothetical protein